MNNLQPASWKDLRWIEPQSRWLLQTFLKRNLDGMTDSARRGANWIVLAVDVIVIYIVIRAF